MEKKINLVLPIAGLGQRFIDGGYETPKPLINFKGQYIIERAMDSVAHHNCNLFFIVRQEHIDQFNIDTILKDKFGDNIHITAINYTTEGAVCTCMLIEEYIDNNNELIIFTPDCYFEPQFKPNRIDKKYDGMVVVFNSDSPAHSYVTLNDNGYVTSAAEKEVISNNAVGGLYYYRKGSDFVKYTKQMINDNNRTKNEFYICPVFNYLIKDGGKVGIDKNSFHQILGTPEDLKREIYEVQR